MNYFLHHLDTSFMFLWKAIASDNTWITEKRTENTEYCEKYLARSISWFFLVLDCHRLTNKKSHKKIKCWCLKIYHKSAWWSHQQKNNATTDRLERHYIHIKRQMFLVNDWLDPSKCSHWFTIVRMVRHLTQFARSCYISVLAKFMLDLVMSKTSSGTATPFSNKKH